MRFSFKEVWILSKEEYFLVICLSQYQFEQIKQKKQRVEVVATLNMILVLIEDFIEIILYDPFQASFIHRFTLF
ncbi:hypothetical protein MTBBW1_790060 [Desulfamplus magnetovallimortis]|uniref:Uncharacterized protein n=1 Tax=Desulfamplus magnetovallimortis TaxID=1246637 RepID=A0A1W1HJW2_9BACT|nr:hypothetical protein MTBBW1_790060 [Desulfamplus magnetovallimortis]